MDRKNNTMRGASIYNIEISSTIKKDCSVVADLHQLQYV